ncbi:MAG: ATP-dependent sacrificial sulfur transferase LarE [Candidatus Lokiarchaeota archaeon]|nr:ATP-dependent sacrificial sulfur transferase LarE [Candidatus Lokiarchaeota archaeon]
MIFENDIINRLIELINIKSVSNEKIKKIEAILSNKKIVVAFSGGVDSSLIAYLAKKFGMDAYAITIKNEFITDEEFEAAKSVANEIGINWNSIQINVLTDPIIQNNPPDRCYFCKKKIMRTLENIRKIEKFDIIVDGTNADDANEYRPGLLASEELNIISPFKEVGMTKDEIRNVSKEFELSTWNKPSMACIATRFPYFDSLDPKKIEMVRKSEFYIKNEFKIQVLRVRFQNDEARIEIGSNEMEKILNNTSLRKINDQLKINGFKKVFLDLAGYQSGIYDKTQLNID